MTDIQYIPQSCKKEINNIYQLHSNNIHQLYNKCFGYSARWRITCNAFGTGCLYELSWKGWNL